MSFKNIAGLALAIILLAAAANLLLAGGFNDWLVKVIALCMALVFAIKGYVRIIGLPLPPLPLFGSADDVAEAAACVFAGISALLAGVVVWLAAYGLLPVVVPPEPFALVNLHRETALLLFTALGSMGMLLLHIRLYVPVRGSGEDETAEAVPQSAR
jgi:hypothetical protein